MHLPLPNAELCAKWNAEPPQHRYALIALMVVAIVLRVANLDYPIRIDEKATLALYVTKPWAVALSDYSLPNNHLFHTALAKVSTSVFGVSLWALRLPALVDGILYAIGKLPHRAKLSPRDLATLAVAVALINGTSVLLWSP